VLYLGNLIAKVKKMIKKYYAQLSLIGLFLFAYTCAYYSTPMLPSVETEFKSSVYKEYNSEEPKLKPINKELKNI